MSLGQWNPDDQLFMPLWSVASLRRFQSQHQRLLRWLEIAGLGLLTVLGLVVVAGVVLLTIGELEGWFDPKHPINPTGDHRSGHTLSF